MSIPESTISLLTKTAFTLVLISATMVCFGESMSFVRVGMMPVFPDLTSYTPQTYKFVTLYEAEKVLAEKAHVKDSAWKNSGGISRFLNTIVANEADKKTGKTRKLFFSFENYPLETDAKDLYNSIKTENEKTAPATAFPETGDEAFLIKDAEGNPFIMIRKANKIFKLKIYNAQDKNSFERLKTLAKRIVADN